MRPHGPSRTLVRNAALTAAMLTVAACADRTDPTAHRPQGVNATVDLGPTCPIGDVFTTIPQIQGSGSASPMLNMAVITGGVVTAVISNGFYLQDPTGDGDAATSDGIFIFTNSQPTVSIGDLLKVVGTVSESVLSETSITGPSVIRCGTGSVTPLTLPPLPLASATEFEKYEGMLVEVAQKFTVVDVSRWLSARVIVQVGAGAARHPAELASPGAPSLAVANTQDLSRLTFNAQFAGENLVREAGTPTESTVLRVGDTIDRFIGVLSQNIRNDGGSWKIETGRVLGGIVPTFTAGSERSTTAPARAGSLRVASVDLDSYFNTFSLTCNAIASPVYAPYPCGAKDQTEFDRQVKKIMPALIAMNADILVVADVENDGYGSGSALAHLRDQLNTAMGAGTYELLDADRLSGVTNLAGIWETRVAMLYKPALVAPTGTTAAIANPAVLPPGATIPNRNSLVQAFTQLSNDARFVLVANRFRTRNLPLQGVAGDLSNETELESLVRAAGAADLVTALAKDPSATGEPDVLLVGNWNAYAQEAPLVALRNGGYQALGAANAFSSVVLGRTGSIDRPMASASMVSQVAAAVPWTINARESFAIDYTVKRNGLTELTALYSPDMYRSMPRDPWIIDLNLTGRDATPPSIIPSITGTLGSDGWYRSNVTVAWNVTDAESAITSQSGCSTSSVTADTPGITFTCSAASTGGSATQSVTVKRDATAPSVSVVGVTNGATYVAGSVPTAACSTSDATSGVATAATATVSGALGTVTATCAGATDRAGNAAAPVTVKYTVAYTFSGFFPPLSADANAEHVVRSGRSVAVTFSLGQNAGLAIFAAGFPLTAPIACDTTRPQQEITDYVKGNTKGLSYDAATQRYTWVFTAERAWLGTCRLVTLRFVDGTERSVRMRVVR